MPPLVLTSGRSGNDVLLGGVGRDTFRFDAKPVKSRYGDIVVDFSIDDDRFQLSRSVFKKVGLKGVLSESAFEIGSVATTETAHIVYDKASSGTIYYDADGSGSGARLTVATIAAEIDLKASHHLRAPGHYQ